MTVDPDLLFSGLVLMGIGFCAFFGAGYHFGHGSCDAQWKIKVRLERERRCTEHNLNLRASKFHV